MDIAPADLVPIRELYLRGLYRQALAAGARLGPLKEWRGPAGRLMAGRLAIQLGAPKTGHRLHLVAYRESPAYLEAVYYHARYRLDRFGPAACWMFARRQVDWSDAQPELRADWLLLQGLALAQLKDLDRAERCLKEADALAPDRPWVAVERSSVLEALDRRPEAIQSARHSLVLQADFRPGVQALTHLLQLEGKTAEAYEVLDASAARLESGVLYAQLASLRYERRDYAGATDALDRYEELSPLLEDEAARWLSARRADVAYRLGDYSAAAAFARKIDEPFYRAYAEKLGGEVDAGGKLPPSYLLELPHGPADASAVERLAAFYKLDPPKPPDEGESSEAVEVGDRLTLERAGWSCREFTMSAEPIRAILSRGWPFVATLIDAGYGQTRLVHGYDPVRQSVHFADGPEGRSAEAPLPQTLERYAAAGPRGLVALPPGAGRAELDALELPDSEVYDALNALNGSLAARKLAKAHAALEELRAKFPDHRVRRLADLAWARATANPVLALDAVTDLRGRFPRDPSLALIAASTLRDLGRNAERKAVLAEAGGSLESEPLVTQSYAQMLLPLPSRRAEAGWLLRRALRARPQAAPGYYLLGTLNWELQEFDEGLEYLRFATLLDPDEEQFSDGYARAAFSLERGNEALRLAQSRAGRGDSPDPAAARALDAVLLARGDLDFAEQALDRAASKAEAAHDAAKDSGRDPSLGGVLFARAESFAASGRFAEARADAARAETLLPPRAAHRGALAVARLLPEYRQATRHAEALWRLDPFSADELRAAVAALAETEGRTAAKRALASAVQRYPAHYGLAKLRAEYLYPDHDDAALAATRELLALCPDDAWTHRQLALLHADRKEHDAALEQVQIAGKLEPNHPSYFAVLSHVHRRADRPDDAAVALRDALALNPDYELAAYELVQTASGADDKRAALADLAEMLHATEHTGDGLLAYFNQATDYIDAPEHLDTLVGECESFLEERPDLWQAYSALGQLYNSSGRHAEALSLARTATERFPMVGRVWIDLSIACRANELPEDRTDALKQAARVSPGWVAVGRELAEALAESDEPGDALHALRVLARQAPADPIAHWLLAERLWQTDRGREAFDAAKRAVRLDTGADPRGEIAWNAVQAWADRVEADDEPMELARELTLDRAGDPRAWLRFARVATSPAEIDAALEALDRAIALDPKMVEAHDLKAERLAALGRFDEALVAARPESLAGELPIILQGRAAWIEARRGNYPAAIPPMQALVAVDPDYIWGWQQLAEWYNDIGKSESYLEASDEFLRLRPDHPVPLTMRGEARLQTGDRDAGKEDLREALRIHPSYSPAAVILFDACLADGEEREARAALSILQEHLSGPEVLVKQVQFGARTADPKGALRAFRQLCKSPGEQPAMFLQIALNELLNADLGDQAADALGDAWQVVEADEDGDGDDDPDEDGDGGPHFNPWAPLFWLDTPQAQSQEPEDRLPAVDAALAAYPNFVPALDRRAELLCESERYDEALACCAPAAGGAPAPVALRGRAAWVEAQRGNRALAVTKMQELLAEEPDYSWGWRQLTIWFDQLDRQRDCLLAADNLVRLNPSDPVAHGIRGEAKQSLGDTRGAQADFARAFELDANFAAAGLHLVRTQLETDDLAGAEKTIAKLREKGGGPLTTLRAVQLAARQGDLSGARAQLRELLEAPDLPRVLVLEAVEALQNAGWGHEADEELGTAVAAASVTPVAAAIWVDRLCAAGQAASVADRLGELAARSSEAARLAVLHYAAAQAKAGEGPAVTTTVQRFAEILRGDDGSWAAAGATLVGAKQFAHAAAWLADYATRPEWEAWMLRPLLHAHLEQKRDADAEAVCAAVMGHEDDPPAEFAAWRAVFRALAGATDEADEALDSVDPVGQPDAVRLVLSFGESLVAVQRSADKPRALEEAKRDLQASIDACRAAEVPPGARRLYPAVVRRLAADAGTWAGTLWALGQRLRPWLPVSAPAAE